MKKLHDRIMQAGLPPLNVDAALVQITGMYSLGTVFALIGW